MMTDFASKLARRDAMIRDLVLKARHDAQFRARLKADPVAVVEEVLGLSWPAGVTLDVIEETPQRCVLVLPAVFAPANDDELSDDDLERVAAGSTPTVHKSDTPSLSF